MHKIVFCPLNGDKGKLSPISPSIMESNIHIGVGQGEDDGGLCHSASLAPVQHNCVIRNEIKVSNTQ